LQSVSWLKLFKPDEARRHGKLPEKRVVVRGGGDLASGVILRLHHCGFKVLVTELDRPLVVRRTVAFAEAIYEDKIRVEGVTGQRIASLDEAEPCWNKGVVPIYIDPEGMSISALKTDVLVDARMMKEELAQELSLIPLIVGLGPGFCAGRNCHAVIETQRGPFLGRVIWSGKAEPNTGIPEIVQGHGQERVLRAPLSGVLHVVHQIGDFIEEGEILGDVNGFPVRAPFGGMIRGLIRHNIQVSKDMKIGDIDPRRDPRLIQMVSDKALAIGGGVLEAILTVR
jgi:xanthine dehydrogenase accessory factor